MGKSIRDIIREKGLKPHKYIILMIVMWFGFEVIGGILGTVLFGGGIVVYLLALAGAALGGYLSYNIAKKRDPSRSRN